MLRRIVLIIGLFLWFFCSLSFASDESQRLNNLIEQLSGKTCIYEIQGSACVNRNPFSFLIRRSDKELCVIDAAKALGMMGARARPAVPSLIEALNKYHNVDSGDGIIPVRSEIALALGRIGDPAAIKPLIEILVSEDPVTLSATASVPAGYKLVQRTSHGAVAEALSMFGPLAKEALPVLNALADKQQSNLKMYETGPVEEAIKKIER